MFLQFKGQVQRPSKLYFVAVKADSRINSQFANITTVGQILAIKQLIDLKAVLAFCRFNQSTNTMRGNKPNCKDSACQCSIPHT